MKFKNWSKWKNMTLIFIFIHHSTVEKENRKNMNVDVERKQTQAIRQTIDQFI